jgi:hypothetical protein
VEEFRVPGRNEREHAEKHRNGEAARTEAPARLLEHRLDLLDRVQRLGHHQVRAGGQLALQAVPLGGRVGRRRIEGAGDREAGRLADRRAGLVLAPVEAREDLDQPDRVDVPHAGPRRVVADPWRVAGQRDDVAHAQRVRAEQLGLESHQVPVARRGVDEALEIEVVLDAESDRERAHPNPGHGRVRHVDRVDPGLLEQPGGLDRPLDAHRAGRVDLDRDHEPAGGEQFGETRRRRGALGRFERGPIGKRRAGLGPRARADRLTRNERVERSPHRRDVLGRRPATPTDDPCPDVDHLLRDLPEVLGARRVDEAAFEPLRQPGVRHDRARRVVGCGPAHRLEGVDRGVRTDSAVDPNHVGPG